MGDQEAHWVVNVVPFIAAGLVLSSYDKLFPKLFWIGLLIISFALLPPYGLGGVATTVMVIHIFVTYFRQQRIEKEKKERMLDKAFEAQRNNYR